ncbi:pilin [Thiocapsa rosea]|uniref:Pilin n=1 Tax=Thiocapsa rosea TaxID=69360 RepID=A0A495VEK0_9GAMM|nr:pilin [Thiocapsa rosea]RKT47033.1 pilin [Thiocapsa rosea]
MIKANWNDCFTDPSRNVSKYVKSINLSAGSGVNITITGTGAADADNKDFFLRAMDSNGDPMSFPTDFGKHIHSWQCGVNKNSDAIAFKYLPSNCVQLAK